MEGRRQDHSHEEIFSSSPRDGNVKKKQKQLRLDASATRPEDDTTPWTVKIIMKNNRVHLIISIVHSGSCCEFYNIPV